MGNSKSKKVQREPDKFFERERWKEQRRDEIKKKNLLNKRPGKKDGLQMGTQNIGGPTMAPLLTAQAKTRCYDEEAIDRMRYQLNNDASAFLLNNILLSVQFFENYERELQSIKTNPISEREHDIDEAMVRHHKHVFFADRLQECVNEHMRFQRQKKQLESLTVQRLFVIYDNVEPSEPGDTSDYSTVLDAPFYKLVIENSKEPGFIKLKKLEVLESTLAKEEENHKKNIKNSSDDSLYTESEKESLESDDEKHTRNGQALLDHLKTKLENADVKITKDIKFKETCSNIYTSCPDIGVFQKNINLMDKYDLNIRNPMIKQTRRLSGPIKDVSSRGKFHEIRSTISENNIAEDTETSGYRSNSSSKLSEPESEYGYATITESTTPKRIELSSQNDNNLLSGILPEECWTPLEIRSFDTSSDNEDDEEISSSPKTVAKKLYETSYYLNSQNFMINFVDNYLIKLGSCLGLHNDEIKSSLTQAASVYCEILKNGAKNCYEIMPGLVASWPNAANHWIIRERKIIQNPRTNLNYQWPTKYMVNKAIGSGCILIPIGFRPKRGLNPYQKLQWRILFPAAERYLESCLAHSHVRCYLFSLLLKKTFLENEGCKMGLDASHLKNHLFWHCEDNYAKWPEDRLGETLRLFLKSFYVHFAQGRFPNYFIEHCNDFKTIPKPMLLKLQKKLADILEAPVMHLLHALDKVKYTKKEFYPTFNCHKLYEILTCRNPLRIINPNIPASIPNYRTSSDSEDDTKLGASFWDRSKDKQYQWKKERQRQIQERRKAQNVKKHKSTTKIPFEIQANIILPKKLDVDRRRLVFDLFIPHFIAMARSSEKLYALRQAVIYLEQARRLAMLLLEEPAGEITANDYLEVIHDKLADCQGKLASQGGFKLPPRRESYIEKNEKFRNMRKTSRHQHIISQDSPTDCPGIMAFTFADIHADNSSNLDSMRFVDMNKDEESKL